MHTCIPSLLHLHFLPLLLLLRIPRVFDICLLPLSHSLPLSLSSLQDHPDYEAPRLKTTWMQMLPRMLCGCVILVLIVGAMVGVVWSIVSDAPGDPLHRKGHFSSLSFSLSLFLSFSLSLFLSFSFARALHFCPVCVYVCVRSHTHTTHTSVCVRSHTHHTLAHTHHTHLSLCALTHTPHAPH